MHSCCVGRSSRPRGAYAQHRRCGTYERPDFANASWIGADARAPAARHQRAPAPRGPPPPPPRDAGAAVVLLMATHVDSHGRLMSLVRCLESLAPQPTKAYIGWHATDPALRAAALEALAKYAKRCAIKPSFVEAAARRRQFEHYEALSRRAEAEARAAGREASTWVIFSDDDDISAPDRSQRFAAAIGSPALPRGCRGLMCPDAMVRPEDGRADGRSIDGAAEVDRAIRDRDCLATELTEHWSFAVRVDLLRAFFASHGPGVLAHSLCDLRFREWIRASTQPTPSFRVRAPEWIYFYDGRAAQHEHAHLDQTDVDGARAARLGVDVRFVALMRSVGEMGFVIGFDGPILGGHLPYAQRRRAALDLILEALTRPQDLWSSLDDAGRRRYRAAAEDVADELFAQAETFFPQTAPRVGVVA